MKLHDNDVVIDGDGNIFQVVQAKSKIAGCPLIEYIDGEVGYLTMKDAHRTLLNCTLGNSTEVKIMFELVKSIHLRLNKLSEV